MTCTQHGDPEAAREAARKAGKENLVRVPIVNSHPINSGELTLRSCPRLQSVLELQKEGFLMTERQWMTRIVRLHQFHPSQA